MGGVWAWPIQIVKITIGPVPMAEFSHSSQPAILNLKFGCMHLYSYTDPNSELAFACLKPIASILYMYSVYHIIACD